MFAGLNVFFWMIMVLSETDAVREGVTMGVGKGMDILGEGVAGATAGVTAGCPGGDSEHPQMNINERAIMRRSGTGFIDATQIFPYNKLMALPVIRAVFVSALRCYKILLSRGDTGNR
jgi:hypothetical protein